MLHGSPALAGGGDQIKEKAALEIGIKARGVRSGRQDRGKKGVQLDGMARFESNGNVGLINVSWLGGKKGS